MRILFIIVIIVVCAGILLFFFFNREDDFAWSEQLDGFTASEDSHDSLPSAETASIVAESQAVSELPVQSMIIDADVLGPALRDDQIIYYDQWDNEIKSVNLLGESLEDGWSLGNTAAEIIWSDQMGAFIYMSAAGEYYYVDLADKTDILLGNNISSPAWRSDGQLWYYFRDPDGSESSIRIGSPAGNLADGKTLTPIRSEIVLRSIPGTQKVAYYLYPDRSRESPIYVIESAGNKEIIVNKSRGTEACWSPDGSRMVFTRLGHGDQVELWLAGGDGKGAEQLTRATYIDKIVWSADSDKLYIAVPKVFSKFTDYQEGAETEDRLFEIDLTTGEFQQLLDFDEAVDARSMFLSRNGKILYLINKRNGSLYAINLDKINKN